MKILRNAILFVLWAAAGVVGWVLLFPPAERSAERFSEVASSLPANAAPSTDGSGATVREEISPPWGEVELAAGDESPDLAALEVTAAPQIDLPSPSDMSEGAAPGAPSPAAVGSESPAAAGVSIGHSVTANSATGGLSYSGIGVGGGGNGTGSIGVGNVGTIGYGSGVARDEPASASSGVPAPETIASAAEAATAPVPIQLDVSAGAPSGRFTREAAARPRISTTSIGQAAAPPVPMADPAPPAQAAEMVAAPPPASAAPAIATSADVSVFAELDRIIDSLPIGTIAFNTPETIPFGDSATIELLLSPQETAEIEEQLRNSVRGPGPVETAQIPIAYRMRAELRGTGAKIVSSSPEEQAISFREPTRWQWTIEPEHSDMLELNLTLSAVVVLQGDSTARAIRTFERTILVNVPVMVRVARFLGSYEVILTLLVVPVVGWIFRRARRKRRQRRQPPHPPAVTREAA